MPKLPPTKRAAVALGVATPGASSVLSGGDGGRERPCRAPRRSRPPRPAAGWPTMPHDGPGRRRAGRGRPRCSAATWAGLVPLSGLPFDRVLRLVSPPVRPALRLALRAVRNRRILPEIPQVLGGSIPPGSIERERQAGRPAAAHGANGRCLGPSLPASDSIRIESADTPGIAWALASGFIRLTTLTRVLALAHLRRFQNERRPHGDDNALSAASIVA